MLQVCLMYHEKRCTVCLILNKALLSQICFYLSGSVFMPMTGLNLSKTLLAANNIVPSPTEKTDQKLVSLHVLLPECTPALSLCAFILITNQASWTKIQWDKTTWHLSNRSSDNWIQDGKHDWKKYNLSDSYTCPGNWMWQKQALKEIYGNFCTFISR